MARIQTTLVSIIFALTACKPAEQPKETRPAQEARPATPAPGASTPASALVLQEETPDLHFSWRVPPQVGAIPPLLHWMRADAERTLADARQAAAEDKALRPANLPFTGHFYDENWVVESDTQRLLSLRGTIEMLTGGAHGNQTFASILWDKAVGHRIAFASLFASWPEARAAIMPLYCAELDRQRAKRRGGEKLGGEFDACPPLDDQPITLVGGQPKGLQTIRIRLSPYIAGPYAEGGYDLTIKLPEAAHALLKPPYRREFSQ